MKQIAISLNRHTKDMNISLEGDVATATALGSFSKWTRPGWTILCWGDPANQDDDSRVVRNVLNGQHSTFWGRSWVAIDHLNSVIHGGTDQLGLFPIVCFENDSQIVISDNRSCLLSKLPKPQLSPSAMRSLIAFGQLFQEQALTHDTRFLTGRTLFTVGAQRNGIFNAEHTPLLGGWETNFDNALEAFVESVRRCFKHQSQPLISLSGGLDSRLILSAAIALGEKPIGLSYGQQSSSDITIARYLANAANIPLFTGHFTKNTLDWSLVQHVAQWGGGEVALQHAHAAVDSNLLEQTERQVILTGTGAETSRAFYYDRGMPGYSVFGQRHFKAPLMQRATQYIEQEFMKSAHSFFEIAPQYRDEMVAELRTIISQHVDSFQTPALFLDNFYLQHRVPRMVGAGQQLLDHHYARSHPFLDQDALFYMAHLPVRYKLASTFHRKAIAKLAPQLSSIVWDKTNLPMHRGLSLAQRYPAMASRFGRNHWGKKATPMFNFEQWLSSLPIAVTRDTLAAMQCLPDQPNASFWQSVKQNSVLAGFSSVWSTLNTHETQAVRKSA